MQGRWVGRAVLTHPLWRRIRRAKFTNNMKSVICHLTITPVHQTAEHATLG